MITLARGWHYERMRVNFVPQPFDDESNLIDFIDYATSEKFDHLRVAVAWAKQSGLGRVRDQIKDFQHRGGTVEIIVGVSEGGATREGLEQALELADRGYVFHHPDRTFHPKVYLAKGENGQSLFVGSSNLTAGGLAWNYEASLWVDWESGEDFEAAQDVEKWLDRLILQEESCKPLTQSLIEQIAESPDLLLGSELRGRRVVAKKGDDTPEDNDSAESGSAGGIFARVVENLRKLPPLSRKVSTLKGTKRAATPATPVPTSKATAVPIPSDLDTVHRWHKRLDNTAAQQPKSTKSNPTGNLRLSQSESEIEHQTYFYEVFFENLPWAPTPGKTTEQEVMVAFYCWIDGTDYGLQEIRISHDPRRVADQGNVPTVMHWGPLTSVLKSTSYIDYFVTLERERGGKFNLFISKNPRGAYIS